MLLKIPIALPYPVYNEEYQSLQNEFEHEGNYYKGIKQKVQGDTLYIVCIKDNNKKHLSSTMTKYAKETNDLPAQEKKQTLSKLLKEYEPHSSLKVMEEKAGWCAVKLYSIPSLDIIAQDFPILSPPPKV